MSTKQKTPPAVSPRVLEAMKAMLLYPEMGLMEVAATVGVDHKTVLRAARMLYRAHGVRMLAEEVRRLREEVQSMRRVIDELREDPLLRATREEMAQRAIRAMGSSLRLRHLLNKVKASRNGG